MPNGDPYIDDFETGYYYEMEKTNYFSDLEKRLIVDWGKDPINWFKKATKELEVIELKPNQNTCSIKPFKNYEELLLSYDQLLTIIENQDEYMDYYQALNSVNGIYLICDTETGKQYVGTTYGQEGIWGRWSGYAKTLHNCNKGMISELEERPDAYKKFQYVILRILQKPIDQSEAQRIEDIYKNKLCSRLKEFGMNKN